MKKYDLIVCGGTFDLLHKGHKSFLSGALSLSDKLLLGITSNSYIESFKNADVEDFEIRKDAVINFLDSLGAVGRVEIVPINQAYEPLLTSEFSPGAIAVTHQTEKTAIEINEKRKELNLPPLEIIIIPMDLGEDGKEISSTRIRSGEINRNGRLYVNPDWKRKRLILPEDLRPELHKPFGKIYDVIPSGLIPEKTIAVGDITVQKFNDRNIGQFLSIVDFQVQRHKEFDKLSDLGFSDEKSIVVQNPPGSISWDLFESVRLAFANKERQVIQVDGEEDLSFLPVMLFSPLGFTVFYGQPDVGLVEVLVTEDNKEKAYEFLTRFNQA